MTAYSRLPFGVLILALSWACVPAPSTPPEGDPVTYAAYVEPVVLSRCLACHTADEPKAELVLEPGVGYDELVSRSSIQVPGMALVKPGDPEASYLWLKVDQRPVVGDGMPRTLFGARRLPDAEVDLFRRWIADGALP